MRAAGFDRREIKLPAQTEFHTEFINLVEQAKDELEGRGICVGDRMAVGGVVRIQGGKEKRKMDEDRCAAGS